MSQGRNRLHFNRVTGLKRVIKNPGGVNDLPAKELVVHVPDKEGLCSKGIGLDIDFGPRQFVHERRFADIGVPAENESASVWVNRRQTGQMLTDLFQVRKRVLLPLHNRGHSSKGSSLQLLATEQRVTKLEETNIVFSDRVDQVTASVDLGQGEFVVITVVEDVHEISIEGMDLIQFRKVCQDLT
jgi:hypothetical protein